MLEHQKKVIEEVAFNKSLFKKELFKSLDWLENDEIKELHRWLKEKFGHLFKDIIEEAFYTIAA